MKRGLLIVISGPSGAGKGTICHKILEDNPNISLSISTTTRSKRGFEIDGKDYYFVSKEEFQKKIEEGKFLEYALVHSNYYGTDKSLVEKALEEGRDIILEIDIQGALKIKELIKDGVFIFITPPSMKILLRRLIDRNTESKDQILERFKTAYKEINESTKYNYVVINDEIENAVKKIESIILAEKCRVDRINDIDLGNEEEIIHEFFTSD
mgnify:FL=1